MTTAEQMIAFDKFVADNLGGTGWSAWQVWQAAIAHSESTTAETVSAWEATQKAKWNEESNSLIGQQGLRIEVLEKRIAELEALISK